VIAADYYRKLTGFKYCFDFGCELFASVADLANVLEFVVDFGGRLWTFEPHVSEIVNSVSESRNAFIQTRDPQCRWSHADSGHARTVIERHTENSD
jgi:hypothetical protein